MCSESSPQPSETSRLTVAEMISRVRNEAPSQATLTLTTCPATPSKPTRPSRCRRRGPGRTPRPSSTRAEGQEGIGACRDVDDPARRPLEAPGLDAGPGALASLFLSLQSPLMASQPTQLVGHVVPERGDVQQLDPASRPGNRRRQIPTVATGLARAGPSALLLRPRPGRRNHLAADHLHPRREREVGVVAVDALRQPRREAAIDGALQGTGAVPRLVPPVGPAATAPP